MHRDRLAANDSTTMVIEKTRRVMVIIDVSNDERTSRESLGALTKTTIGILAGSASARTASADVAAADSASPKLAIGVGICRASATSVRRT